MSNPSDWDVCYVMPDAQGGVYTVVRSLVERAAAAGLPSHLVLTRNEDSSDTPIGDLPDVSVTRVSWSPRGNFRSTLRRLHAAIPAGPGVLVCSDLMELAMLSVQPTERAVVQIVHGDYDYYYGLAERHEPLIDAFAVGSEALDGELRRRLPHRAESIFHLPYGVPVATRRRRWESGPLRLIASGRLTTGKGVHHLPDIDRALSERAVAVEWTVVGDGPERDRLEAWFEAPHVTWVGNRPRKEVLAMLPQHDVLVFPTYAEGFSLTLLEAMGAGLVPVASRIPAVTGVVLSGDTGLLADPETPLSFADAIESMYRDPSQLARMGRAAHNLVASRYEETARMDAYLDLFSNWAALRRADRGHVPLQYGSRLDQPWIPNAAVHALRSIRRRLAT